MKLKNLLIALVAVSFAFATACSGSEPTPDEAPAEQEVAQPAAEEEVEAPAAEVEEPAVEDEAAEAEAVEAEVEEAPAEEGAEEDTTADAGDAVETE